jgi:hypothetical protein
LKINKSILIICHESNYANLSESDGHIAKISSDLSHVLYSTYFGSSGTDLVNGVTVNRLGEIYFTGFTTLDDFPQFNNESDYSNSRDIIFVKMGEKILESGNTPEFEYYYVIVVVSLFLFGNVLKRRDFKLNNSRIKLWKLTNFLA